MYLLADSGASKTLWYLASEPQALCQSPGLQALSCSKNELLSLLSEHEQLPYLQVKKLDFYGAACALPEVAQKMLEVLQICFPFAQIRVASDLQAACLALHRPHSQTWIGILGTGSVACTFDGQQLKQRSQALGFWLGDEGSAVDLGKRLLRAYFYGQLPSHLTTAMAQMFDMERGSLLQTLYSQGPKQALFTQYLPFLLANQAEPSLEKLILRAFSEFFEAHLLIYPQAERQALGLLGGVAAAFEPLCRKALAAYLPEAELEILQGPFPKLSLLHR